VDFEKSETAKNNENSKREKQNGIYFLF